MSMIIIKNNNNGSDDIINTILIDKWVVKCKENIEGAWQKKNIDLGYVDYFDRFIWGYYGYNTYW